MFGDVRQCPKLNLLSQYVAVPPHLTLTRPFRWVLFALLTLGFVIAGLPATSASAAADGILKGTVTFHESHPDPDARGLPRDRRRLLGRRRHAHDRDCLESGSYSAHVPAGEPVKLRVSYGDTAYGYWYGDGFNPDQAQTVQAAAGKTVNAVEPQRPRARRTSPVDCSTAAATRSPGASSPYHQQRRQHGPRSRRAGGWSTRAASTPGDPALRERRGLRGQRAGPQRERRRPSPGCSAAPATSPTGTPNHDRGPDPAPVRTSSCPSGPPRPPRTRPSRRSPQARPSCAP